jgi:hypothetical protein
MISVLETKYSRLISLLADHWCPRCSRHNATPAPHGGTRAPGSRNGGVSLLQPRFPCSDRLRLTVLVFRPSERRRRRIHSYPPHRPAGRILHVDDALSCAPFSAVGGVRADLVVVRPPAVSRGQCGQRSPPGRPLTQRGSPRCAGGLASRHRLGTAAPGEGRGAHWAPSECEARGCGKRESSGPGWAHAPALGAFLG